MPEPTLSLENVLACDGTCGQFGPDPDDATDDFDPSDPPGEPVGLAWSAACRRAALYALLEAPAVKRLEARRLGLDATY